MKLQGGCEFVASCAVTIGNVCGGTDDPGTLSTQCESNGMISVRHDGRQPFKI